MEDKNEKKERRVSFAAEVETVFEYEEQRHETTISSDEDFTADLTYENSKQLSILNETNVLNEFFSKDVKELLEGEKGGGVKEDIQEDIHEDIQEDIQEDIHEDIHEGIHEDIQEDTEGLKFFSQENKRNNLNDEIQDLLKISSSVDTKNSPRTKKNKRKSFSPFRKNSPKKKNTTDQENEINSVESSMISNNSVEATEIINTQKLKFMIPQTKKPKSNITELFAMKGIMFLDTISFGKVRRDTLSKTRKPVDPTKILFYKNFLLQRIKFFDDFVEELKVKSDEYENSVESFVNENEEISEMISGEEINKNMKSMMLYARNLAKIEWYELRAKKELAFNEIIIQNKNHLQNKSSDLKGKLENIQKKREEQRERIISLKGRIKSIKEQDEKNQADKKNIEHKIRDIKNYEDLVENLNKTLEDLKIEFNKNLLHKQIQENHLNDLKKEITFLLTNMREVCVSEDQLNNSKAEYDKLCAILNISILQIKKDLFELTFQGYRLKVGPTGLQEMNSTESNNILEPFVVNLIKGQSYSSILDFLFLAFKKIYVFNEFVKDLQNISMTNQTDISVKENDLFVTIVSKNFKLCKTVQISLEINKQLECTVIKDEERYLYNLFVDKGFLLNHFE